ncbi:uncharacterized protein LOC103580441 [Microplitis demolitor]|uniref:uncharacterized protein LOC103580441 n=1 Tax=Microplitis demolitor TaxID=69319 RepID=UPI0004CCD55A|nr:uncharacterized protein LOC103580441 [Microplitis demolitor]
MIQTEKIKKLKKKNFRSLVPRLIKSKAEADKCQSFKNNNSDDNESDSSKSGISCNLVSNFCNTEDEYQEYDREEEDDDKEDNDLEKKLSRLGLCAACHLTVDTTNRGYDKSLLCNEGHVVCQRCIRHYSLDPDEDCLLCADSEKNSPTSNDSNLVYEDTYPVYDLENNNLNLNLNSPDSSSANNKNNQSKTRANPDSFIVNSRNEPEARDKTTRQADLELSYTSLTSSERLGVGSSQITDCSRRPIHCPRLDCAINITFSSLVHHFVFDHPEVPIMSIEPGIKSTLIINASSLSRDSSLCLAILLISGKLTAPVTRLFNGNQIHPKYRNRLPLPVLAARLHSNHPCPDPNNPQRHETQVIAWIAGLDVASIGTLRYTIQVVDDLEDNVRSLAYSGPITSLRIAQRPREVLQNGDCLIIHQGLVNQLTAAGNLNINVIVH